MDNFLNCRHCKNSTKLEDIRFSNSGRDQWCITCLKEYNQKRYVRRNLDPTYYEETLRKSDLKRRYGITLEQYRNLLKTQNYKCAICHTTDPKGKGTWHVDHCHNTKRIRGLLCHNCNAGLGHFKDDASILNKAISYIRIDT